MRQGAYSCLEYRLVRCPRRIGEKLARLLGAGEGQVIICDCTSINLFKLAMWA
jgi:kynureninase